MRGVVIYHQGTNRNLRILHKITKKKKIIFNKICKTSVCLPFCCMYFNILMWTFLVHLKKKEKQGTAFEIIKF